MRAHQISGFAIFGALSLFAQNSAEQQAKAQAETAVVTLTGEVIGRVVDEDSGKPHPSFSISIVGFSYRYGVRRIRQSPVATVTDSEGRFRVSGLAPGSYGAVVASEAAYAAEVLTTFSPDDIKAVDQDYETSYWPGGGGLEAAIPVTVPPAGIGYIGTVKLRKTPFYRVHVSVPAAVCNTGEIVQVRQGMLDTFTSRLGNLSKIPCGKDFLVRRLPPGRYSFNFSTVGGRLRDTIAFEVKDRNIRVAALLHPGAEIDGQVVLAEGAATLPPDLRIATFSYVSFLDLTQPVTPNAQGGFHLSNLSFGPRRLELVGMDSGHYVKDILYNDAALSDRIFNVAGSGTLRLVIDDKPGTIRGTVSEGDRPVTRPYVLLSKWPPESDYVHIDPKGIVGGEDGRFQFGGLAPGEYRLFAVSGVNREKLDQPGALNRLLNTAEKISIDPRGSQTVSLKLIDPAW